MNKEQLIKKVEEDNIKFISLQFTDITGSIKSVDIPVTQLSRALEEGIGFDGSSVEGFARVEESDMKLIPDISTYVILPWTHDETKTARMFCDIHMPNGKPFLGDPRGQLKRFLNNIKDEQGWTFNIGAEPEFFLFETERGLHPVPHDVGGYFDFATNDKASIVRFEIMQALIKMNIIVEMGHHEVSKGQHEIDIKYSDALSAADNVATFKYTTKAIAQKHGLIASFMPKPVFGINGSGMHCHQSIFGINDLNLFCDEKNNNKLSKLALHFIGGQLHHAKALSAIVAPTINSYKRLVPGYEAPVNICWARKNRSALIRVPQTTSNPKSVRAELRCPDPSANPYIAFLAMLAAGLDGLKNHILPPDPVDGVDVYHLSIEERKTIESLPGSLAEALGILSTNEVIKSALGETLIKAFFQAKNVEIEEHRTLVTDWEIKRYLEIA